MYIYVHEEGDFDSFLVRQGYTKDREYIPRQFQTMLLICRVFKKPHTKIALPSLFASLSRQPTSIGLPTYHAHFKNFQLVGY